MTIYNFLIGKMQKLLAHLPTPDGSGVFFGKAVLPHVFGYVSASAEEIIQRFC
jgi:hypothetical protein